jgi:hypothetical protein
MSVKSAVPVGLPGSLRLATEVVLCNRSLGRLNWGRRDAGGSRSTLIARELAGEIHPPKSGNDLLVFALPGDSGRVRDQKHRLVRR